MNELEQIKRNAKDIVANYQRNNSAVKLPPAPAAAELGSIRCQFVLVTPEIARQWLCNNKKNRDLREDTVVSYAHEMRSGNWLVTHQGIAFNDRNELIDGQHRLHGVIRSNTPVTILVTTGLPSKLLGKKITVMDTVDRGATRSLGDQLSIEHGIQDANMVAGVCKILAKLCLDGDGARRARKPSVSQILDIFSTYKDSIVFAIAHRPQISSLRTKGVVAAAAFAHAVHPNKIAEYYFKLSTGENLTSESPILALRNKLMTSTTVRLKGSVSTPVPEMVLQAFYYCVAEKQSLPQLNLTSALRGGIEYFSSHQQDKIGAVKKLFELPAEKKSDDPVVTTPAAAASRKRTMEDVLRAVERAFGIAQAIILGKGTEDEINCARCAFVALSIEAGYSVNAICAIVRRPAAYVKAANGCLDEYIKPNTKRKAAFEKLRAELFGKQ